MTPDDRDDDEPALFDTLEEFRRGRMGHCDAGAVPSRYGIDATARAGRHDALSEGPLTRVDSRRAIGAAAGR